MPLFFNLESHLWIAYLFFFNGLLVCLLLRSASGVFANLTQSFESLVVFSFAISISLNGCILFTLDYFDSEFGRALWGLIAISALIVAMLCGLYLKNKALLLKAFTFEWGYLRLVLYGLIFILLFYNGGMIDQLSDAWWHMSLANKMAMANSFNPELGHLTSAPERYYPPLWHINLALAHISSGESIPVLWNSFTAWGATIKVMAFYCLTFALTRHKYTALLAAILFVLLPGIGNSYLRVSAWPSHIAFTVWYLMLFVFFTVVHGLSSSTQGHDKASLLFDVILSIKDYWLSLLILLGLAVVVYFTHQTELLWFCVACFTYCAASSISRIITKADVFIANRDHPSLRITYRLMLFVLIAIALLYVINDFQTVGIDQALSGWLPVMILFALLFVEFDFIPRNLKFMLLAVGTILILLSLNGEHFLSLFFPEMAVPRGTFHESPSSVAGYFGGALDLPGWHLQLRSGLLYSGILAVPLSLFLVILKPNPASLFIFGTALLAISFCLSPYLYHWLKDILAYHSPWRVAALILHPIIFSVCFFELACYVKGRIADEH